MGRPKGLTALVSAHFRVNKHPGVHESLSGSAAIIGQIEASSNRRFNG